MVDTVSPCETVEHLRNNSNGAMHDKKTPKTKQQKLRCLPYEITDTDDDEDEAAELNCDKVRKLPVEPLVFPNASESSPREFLNDIAALIASAADREWAEAAMKTSLHVAVMEGVSPFLQIKLTANSVDEAKMLLNVLSKHITSLPSTDCIKFASDMETEKASWLRAPVIYHPTKFAVRMGPPEPIHSPAIDDATWEQAQKDFDQEHQGVLVRLVAWFVNR